MDEAVLQGLVRAVQQAAPASVLPPNALSSNAPVPVRRPPAAETVRLYASDWAAFVAWCHEAQLTPLPADSDTVTAYLTSLADTLSYGTLLRRLAAIADQHRQYGLAAPAADPAGKALLREVRGLAIRRRRPRPPSGLLARMAAALQTNTPQNVITLDMFGSFFRAAERPTRLPAWRGREAAWSSCRQCR
jgi:hypothetical protein